MPERRIEIVMNDLGGVKVDFVDDVHFNQREILRIIKTLKVEKRLKVKEYRRKQRLEVIKEQANDGEREQRKSERIGAEQQGKPKQSGDSSNKPERPVEAKPGPNIDLAAAIAAKRRIRAAEGPRGGSDES
jgi:hypothetical protein